MKMFLACLLCSVITAMGVAAMTSSGQSSEKKKLAHAVFFTLKDGTSAGRARFLESCRKYLTGHEGALTYSAGVMAEDVKEPVSDRDFDIALHVVFKDKEAEAKYLKSERHTKFVSENKDVWSKVRVFDSYLDEPEK